MARVEDVEDTGPDRIRLFETDPQALAEMMDSGIRAERDRLLREVTYLKTGQMIGGGGDDLDLAAAIVKSQQAQAEATRADLAAMVEVISALRDELATVKAHEAELEKQLTSTNAAVLVASERWLPSRVRAHLARIPTALRRI
jgi:hypothetical protein